MAKYSTVQSQVMWNRLISVVEEQAQALIRTAFSTSVREAGDLSAGVYDIQGRMLAQAVTGTPGHVNAMAESVGHFMRRIGMKNMFEGRVICTTSPSSRRLFTRASMWAFLLAPPISLILAGVVLGRMQIRFMKKASIFRS
jgi:hypothetical protein